jgi:hypothetical protein
MLGAKSLHSDDSSLEVIELPEPMLEVVEEIARPSGYGIDGLHNVHIVVRSQDLSADGWGTGLPQIAHAKAYSEAIERYTLFLTAQTDPSILTSNGWSAHMDPASARDAAVAELVERDTALRVWFDAGPYFCVPNNLWPLEVLRWQDRALSAGVEFQRINVLLCDGPTGSCVTILLKNDAGCAVTGHASGSDLQRTILSAFFEAIRSAHAALRFDDFTEVIDLHTDASPKVAYGPGANAMAYAYGEKLPELSICEASEFEVLQQWIRHQAKLEAAIANAKVTYFKVGNRFVARAVLKGVLDIFWGRTPKELNVKNIRPHIVG